MLLDNFPSSGDPRVLHANEWVKERLAGAETLDGYDLASRITLAYNLATIGHVTVEANNILIIDVNDQCVTTAHVRQELKSRYPDAKVATLKQGGDFPFLSCASELTLYIEVHLRNCGLFPLREQVLEGILEFLRLRNYLYSRTRWRKFLRWLVTLTLTYFSFM